MQTLHISESFKSRIICQRICITIPSRIEWIEPTVRYLEQHARELSVCTDANRHQISVSLHEAITNAIVHGNLEISSELKEQEGSAFAEQLAVRLSDNRYATRNVEITIDCNRDRIEWSIADSGRGFDIDRILQRAESDEVSLLASGRGVIMMKAFMDDVRYDLGGRRVVMMLRNPHRGELNSYDDCEVDSDDSQIEWKEPQGLPKEHMESVLQADNPGSEKRIHKRVWYSERLSISGFDEPDHFAIARNLSEGGICFICNFNVGFQLIDIELPGSDGPVSVTGQVARCTRITPGIFDVGVRFLESHPPNL